MKSNLECQKGMKSRVVAAISDYNEKNEDQLDLGKLSKLVVDDRELQGETSYEQHFSLRINAKRTMLVHHLKRLSEVLGKTTDYFLGLKPE